MLSYGFFRSVFHRAWFLCAFFSLPGNPRFFCSLRPFVLGLVLLIPISHHGINSRYFSEYVQKILKPQILIVSVDEKNYNEDMNTQIAALCAAGKSNAHYTFQGDLTIQI